MAGLIKIMPEDKLPTVGGIKIIDSSDALEININRRSLKIIGNAWDINRLKHACDAALKEFEFKRHDPLSVRSISVVGPKEDEN
jgi:hypothetical protein